ncbi:glycosyltransferase [Methylobacterium sp.]|uniref:glycosyltransferase n=1 Tax=Methylobacterium sp. TaxID=409 RepID=UPI000FB4037E|nr:glycosyltransferase [Methylobacterium sp.]RUP21859.1 MAG: glycosyltransferase [Methylobacterium sp.]
MVTEGKPTALVVTPMPAAPMSAGNRRRLSATCEALRRGGFAIDLAYLQHEDQIYRRFGQHPPTDAAAMAAAFDRVFHIPAATAIPLKTWTGGFTIDAWCPQELDEFVAWYFERNPDTCAIIINYVFLSRCLDAVPAGVLRVIDTHDRFADRHLQYRPFRAEPNFFYTDRASEAVGLSRANMILAIQSAEADYFRGLVDRDVYLLPPVFTERAKFRSPGRLIRFGFIGHGNDPNLFSISKFAHGWAASWRPDLPVLVIAGEICGSLTGLDLPGVQLAGYVDAVEAFYAGVDAVVAPMLMGSGLKMKVAEALSLGRPVIGTRIAFEGFDTDHPTHRLEGVADTVAAVLSLHDDPDALATLTAACADLLARYNAKAATCEAAWLDAIPRRSARRASSPTARAPDVSTTVGAGIIVREERSLRSLPIADEEGGILVATENPSPATAREAGYPSERRRWFVSPEPDGSRQSVGALPALHEGPVSLSPEWIHRRSLPQPAREAIAGSLGDAQADWTADGCLIGYEADGLTVVACVPSFLVGRSRATAAFLIGDGERARELRLTSTAALARSPGLAFAATRGALTPVPTSLTFEPLEIDGFASPIPAAGKPPSRPKAVLFLSDDLIGLIRLAPAHNTGIEVQ